MTDWQPFETVPHSVLVYARFSDDAIETGTYGKDISGFCWVGDERFYHDTCPDEWDEKPVEWRPITDEDRRLATALLDALEGAGLREPYISAGTTDCVIDGRFDVARAARRFLELANPPAASSSAL